MKFAVVYKDRQTDEIKLFIAENVCGPVDATEEFYRSENGGVGDVLAVVLVER